ncbi:hypothetical protein BLA24_12735 [Streptomyces cinnamoneus]|uniref:Lipoprotein n=1 Tax=Streptomyces cinnamoneus TaxID=53446 RepID=A0A2G1XJZ6_STRCJ|nr:hypothetical protein [Streptomyces cinnamoneus]PHQ51563.1 hypothetical protein BLA24_12735 [Streptomyces cinnamoneus]PPT14354.1 hypothetical protein CYQ11_17090 [Streptomyces cinnamoneus]
MAVQRHRRRGAVVATAVAHGLALGLLVVSGCAEQEPADEGLDVRAGRGGRGGQAQQAHEVTARASADPARALAAVRRASAVLARSGGARVLTSMETVSGGTRLTIQGRGAYDFTRPVGRLTVLLPEDAAGTVEHRPITEVFAPGALYMKNRGAGVPAGKWVRLDTGSLADGDLLTSGATDPLAAAELLGGAREVAYVGDERMRGVRVAHYWGTVDLSRAAQAAPLRDRAPLAAAAKGFSTGTVAFDAYLDEQGRPCLLRYRFGVDDRPEEGPAEQRVAVRRAADAHRPTATAPASAGASAPAVTRAPAPPMSVVSTVELFSFGYKPVIALPAPGEIYAGAVASPQK